MLSQKPILVTGAAGYIGSHTVIALIESGFSPVALDDLSTGSLDLLQDGVPFIKGDVGDIGLIKDVLREHGCGAVIHFAGSIVNPDSFKNPLDYYTNNVSASCNLLKACVAESLDAFIFSSSAAVYGDAKTIPIPENAPTTPVSPYGETKLVTEWIVRDVAVASGMRFAALRYFNVAGADAEGRSGQVGPATHLIKIAAEAATGLRDSVTVFGNDFDTPDGTCIRDYIHVTDIAAAHVNALEYLQKGGENLTLNCGYGKGYSIREVLEMVNEITDAPILVKAGPRRIGDVGKLIANTDRIGVVLGWKPRYGDLRTIVESALTWEQKLYSERTA